MIMERTETLYEVTETLQSPLNLHYTNQFHETKGLYNFTLSQM